MYIERESYYYTLRCLDNKKLIVTPRNLYTLLYDLIFAYRYKIGYRNVTYKNKVYCVYKSGYLLESQVFDIIFELIEIRFGYLDLIDISGCKCELLSACECGCEDAC